jgi:S-methyl-5-thioribose-1-phosphate isomerase/adenine phosphoribosyltransferase
MTATDPTTETAATLVDTPGVLYRRRPLTWDGDALLAVDQRALPATDTTLRLATVDEVIDAIQSLAIRGAPTIGVAGAFGVVVAALAHRDGDRLDEAAVRADAERIANARPTAVDLSRGVARTLARIADGPDAVLAEAEAILDEVDGKVRAAAARAADFVLGVCPDRPLRVLTHCHTGSLATLGDGTALGAIYELAQRGRIARTYADETRPLLQGARLTAPELTEAGLPCQLCVDGAGPAAIGAGLVDCVIVGSDRIAANGDVANKIGTYSLAAAAAWNGVPFVVVAPESTIDESLPSGAAIAIEQRARDEVVNHGGAPVPPDRVDAFNPAFDVTPTALVTAVVTEDRAIPGGWAARNGGEDSAAAALARQIHEHIVVVPDFPSPGIQFQDLSNVFGQPALLRRLARAIVDAHQGEFSHVVAIEARGFILGTAVANEAGCPLVMVRKPGKLPGAVASVTYELEYGSDTLEIQEGALPPGARVLVVDDVLATGGTLQATIDLVRLREADVGGLAVLVELAGLGGRDRLGDHQLLAIHEVKV